MKKWWRLALDIILTLVLSSVLVLLLLLAGSFMYPPLGEIRSEVWASVNRPSELGRFFWEAGTGAPMGGLFAIAAAGIAYLGIKQTVQRSDVANDNAIAARIQAEDKNRADEWWSNLRWAYEQTASGGQHADTFKEKAVMGIFQSLAVSGLSDVQQGTLEQITKVFEAAPESAGSQRVSDLRSAVNASAESSKQRRQYRSSLGEDLARTNWTGMKAVFSKEPGNSLFFRTKKGSLVAVVPLVVDLLAEDAAGSAGVQVREAAREWEGKTLNISDKPRTLAAANSWKEETIAKVLVATNADGYWSSDEGGKLLWARYLPLEEWTSQLSAAAGVNDRLASLREAIKKLATY